jgi:hypothetical protein
MRGNILSKMAKGIEGSAVILICVTRRYMEKVAEDADNNCKFEFEYALNKRTTLNMLPIVMEESVADTSEWRGSLSMTLGRHLYRKLTTDIDADFDDAVTVIAAEIREMIQPQKVLANEMQGAAYTINSRSQSPTPSAASGMDTVPASPQSTEQEVLAMHIDMEVSQFREDMKTFMQSFLQADDQPTPTGGQPAPRKRKLCELLLVAFMRDKIAPSCDAVIAENLLVWQGWCEDSNKNLIDRFHKLKQSLKPPIFEELNYVFSKSSKLNHTSIFVID